MRSLTISLDIAFGKDAEEEVAADEVSAIGSADTVTERRASDEAMESRPVGFGRGPWIDE